MKKIDIPLIFTIFNIFKNIIIKIWNDHLAETSLTIAKKKTNHQYSKNISIAQMMRPSNRRHQWQKLNLLIRKQDYLTMIAMMQSINLKKRLRRRSMYLKLRVLMFNKILRRPKRLF
jgi:hypothetical protein